ncbi:selenocysteine-specific translation elongation factor [Bacillus suaedaesalsae]|uniref:Selenocysteine-specific elongation factor n=1 Tax=Bacillus suaedaesalsae TaxID=2810349 RepID=A0ABS2DIJ1_9BACI|nr:selenocysteine-specific translation elongation factor [Bacillus suaedaesalsae]
MDKHYFTVGMAGHIDHGKTSLTKALTNVDTDRLKEEKERQISIELGFAPLELGDNISASVIDVPGHERFIRQMIAGVAGIDLVILVVAADEGVMPQTKEHLDILSFLGIKKGIVAVSKIDKVDEEFVDLVEEEIKEQLQGTVFADSPIILVDSLKSIGIDQLRAKIKEELEQLEMRNASGAFRLPIDQVFTVKGQGTVVRGTVYEGTVIEGQTLMILPSREETKARQLQVHHKPAEKAVAGQRVAINLSNITKDQIERGDVLVDKEHFVVTNTIDISLSFVQSLKHPIKQRTPIKLHLGTSEVMGKIIFFDRNEATGASGEVLCQLRLDEDVVTKRGDRFILRRPTPTETIGGGWVLDPHGQKYRFGEETIQMLHNKKEGTPTQRVIDILKEKKYLPKKELLQLTSLKEEQLEELKQDSDDLIEMMQGFTLQSEKDSLLQKANEQLKGYQEKYPLRFGMSKAELVAVLSHQVPKEWVTTVIDEGLQNNLLQKQSQFVATMDYEPSYPPSWKKRIESLMSSIQQDGLNVKTWEEYGNASGIPKDVLEELKHYLKTTNKLYFLDEKNAITRENLEMAIKKLRAATENTFDLKVAKDSLDLSRKYLIPLMELFDALEITRREEQNRVWVRDTIE